MSTDFSIKPVGTPVAAPIVQPRRMRSGARGGATELPASQTSRLADASARCTQSICEACESTSQIAQVVFDQAAASIVYQVVDDRTDVVVQQFPDEAVLRRRAYFHAQDLKSEPSRPASTDRSA